jgi:hypothetical protein
MPMISGAVQVEDILDALDLTQPPAGCHYAMTDYIRFNEIRVEQHEIDAEASDVEPEQIMVDTQSIREGVRYALAGDWSMAAIMLHRGLDGHDDAQRAVEEELRWANEQRARAARRAA